MKCHYEVLGLSKDCTDEEIKKSYRKLALQWHPDKNADNVEESTKEFRLVQQAYEVLIDPQERAWYDKHREAILRGGLGCGDKYEGNCLDVYQFFNTACYTGYTDDDEGFYAVYRDVFQKIGLEDEEFLDGENKVPTFGTSQCSYEEVVGPFYAHWESYCTAKSYVWVEKYDTREAPNRQIRRLMEQDNKKLRDKARRERNEEVRALVGFVRKRDKRVQQQKKKLEERAAEIKRLADKKKKRDREERLKKMSEYTETDWSSMSALEQKLQELEVNLTKEFSDEEEEDIDENGASGADDSDAVNGPAAADDGLAAEGGLAADAEDELDDYFDSLYCYACKKSFKSDKAFDNHSRSKKHVENMSRLQLEMLNDDDDVVDSKNDEDNDLSDVCDDDIDTVDVPQPCTDNTDRKSRSKKQKKKQRQQKLNSCVNGNDDDADENHDTHNNDNDDVNSSNMPEVKVQEVEEIHEETGGEAADANDANCPVPAAKTEPQKTAKYSQTTTRSTSSQSFCCNKCHQTFVTRNKLFDHIKATGHALRLDDIVSTLLVDKNTAAAATTTKKRKDKKANRK